MNHSGTTPDARKAIPPPIMMAIMMGGGIALRASGVVPEWFIAFFYTGLGAALAVAGVSFILRYFKSSKPACPAMPGTYTKHHKE